MALSPDDYAAWINQRIGAEVKRRREALGLSAYGLAKLAGLSDQTVLNIEHGHGKNGANAGTLARLCVIFHIGVAEFMATVEGYQWMPQ